MKTLNTARLSLALAGVLSLAACKKESTSTSQTADVSFSMATDNPLVTVASTNGTAQLTTLATTSAITSVKWTDAVANISKFKLEAVKNGAAYELTANGLGSVDLFALTPATINASLPQGTYTHVELQVQLVKSSGTAMPLILKGTYTTKAGTTVPIEFDFNESVALKASMSDLTVDGKNNFVAKLNLHLNKVFGNITAQQVDAATRTSSGTILISSSANTTLYQKIIVDLVSSSEAKLELKVRKS